jgi:hypothetical protein
VRQSAERGVGTRTGCGQRRSEEIGGTRWGDVSTGYHVRPLSIRYDRAHRTQMFSRVPVHHVFMIPMGTRGLTKVHADSLHRRAKTSVNDVSSGRAAPPRARRLRP